MKYKSQFENFIQSNDAEYNFPDPDDPIGDSQINTYLHTVKNIWKEQVNASSNSIPWDLIQTYDVD